MVSRRRRRRRAVVIALVASLVVLGFDLTIRSLSDGPDRRAAYLDEVRPHVEESTQQGLDLLELRRNGATLDRRMFDRRVADLVESTQTTLADVIALEPPESLIEADALLVSTLTFRADAAADLAVAFGGLLGEGTVADARAAVGAVVADLAVADRTFVAFSERTQETDVDAGVPPSSWVTDVEGWDEAGIAAWLTELRASPEMAAITDVGIVTVQLSPAPIVAEGEVSVLATDQPLTVTVVVANQGSTGLEAVTVSATLAVEGEQGQEVSTEVDLATGQDLTVALDPLTPVVGRSATLTITVGPVRGETVAADNTRVIRLRVRDPGEQVTTTTTTTPPGEGDDGEGGDTTSTTAAGDDVAVTGTTPEVAD